MLNLSGSRGIIPADEEENCKCMIFGNHSVFEKLGAKICHNYDYAGNGYLTNVYSSTEFDQNSIWFLSCGGNYLHELYTTFKNGSGKTSGTYQVIEF